MIVLLNYTTSLMVILTKWFDCTTTLKNIHGVAMESNPIARAQNLKVSWSIGIHGFTNFISFIFD